MMHIFAIGASGYIGSTIVARLQYQGHTISGLARTENTAKRLSQMGIQPIRGSIEDRAIIRQYASAADAVIYTAVEFSQAGLEAEYQAIEMLIDTLNGTDKTLIYTSGVGVLGNYAGVTLNEDSRYQPWPLIARRVDTEQALRYAARHKQMQAFIVRPGMVYGGTQGGNGLDFYIKNALQLGFAPYLEDGLNRWPVVHIDDLVDLFLLLLFQKSSNLPSVFHAVTEEEVVLKQIAQAVAEHFTLGQGTQSLNDEQLQQVLGVEAPIFGINQHIERSRAFDCLGWQVKQPSILEEIKTLKRDRYAV